MNKIEIPYYNRLLMMLFMLTAIIPILLVRWISIKLIGSLLVYWIVDIIFFIIIIAVWYRLAYMIPGVKAKAYTWVEQGTTMLQVKGNEIYALNDIEEIFLSEPSSIMNKLGSKSTLLEIRNGGKKIVLLSPPESVDIDITETILYNFFLHLLGKNPQLVPEKTVRGEEIPFWYKAPKERK